MKKKQLTFNQKYRTIHSIGRTNKSQIYKAVNITNEEELAIKLEQITQNTDESGIQKESKVYRLIKGGVGIPNLYWYGNEHDYKALVIDIYGPSLEHLLKFCQGRFSLKTVLLIADQLIDRMQWIHQKNLVYNDIDSENFLVGLGKRADKIFITDFGNCRKFVDEQNNHQFIAKQLNPLKNNIRFRSIHSHIGKKTSRRDDLESLGYVLVYFLKGSLPWDLNQDDQSSQNSELTIKQKKASISFKDLCQNLPDEFFKYFNYIKSLQFEQEPDYVWIKRLFKDILDKSQFVHNNIFDWAERHKY